MKINILIIVLSSLISLHQFFKNSINPYYYRKTVIYPILLFPLSLFLAQNTNLNKTTDNILIIFGIIFLISIALLCIFLYRDYNFFRYYVIEKQQDKFMKFIKFEKILYCNPLSYIPSEYTKYRYSRFIANFIPPVYIKNNHALLKYNHLLKKILTILLLFCIFSFCILIENETFMISFMAFYLCEIIANKKNIFFWLFLVIGIIYLFIFGEKAIDILTCLIAFIYFLYLIKKD